MELKKYEKINIAKILLDKALNIYFDEENYFAVLHLAGASDEILGKYLKEKNIESSFETEKKAFILVSKALNIEEVEEKYAADVINAGRNAIKHMNDDVDKFVLMDPKFDAEAMLNRAITNWWRLEKELSKTMNKFWNRNKSL